MNSKYYKLQHIKSLYENGFNIHKYNQFILKCNIERGNINIVKYIISKGAYIYDDILTTAIKFRKFNIVKYIVENNCLDILEEKDSYCDGECPFALECVKVGNIDMYKYFIEKGCYPDINWALKIATQKNNIEIVEYLVNNGADIFDDGLGENAFDIACDEKFMDIVYFFVDYCISKNDNRYSKGLNMCVHNNDLQLLIFLLEKGADINYDKGSAFQLSIYTSNKIFYEYFINKGVDIHIDNDESIVSAAATGNIEIFNYFKNLGLNIHTKNEKCLAQLAYRHNPNYYMIEYLISLGCDVQEAYDKGLNHFKHGYVSIKRGKANLKKYLPKKIYNGEITEQTETNCGICLEEMAKEQGLFQCDTCKKCVHMECCKKWNGDCVYCRS